ncbi:MAG: hypothetical protein NVS3B14_03160 [Ktedonobacteraceae bacterium]
MDIQRYYAEQAVGKGSMYPVPFTGRAALGFTVFMRQQGKIVRQAIYYDIQEVRRQPG